MLFRSKPCTDVQIDGNCLICKSGGVGAPLAICFINNGHDEPPDPPDPKSFKLAPDAAYWGDPASTFPRRSLLETTTRKSIQLIYNRECLLAANMGANPTSGGD